MKINEYYRDTANISLNGSIAALVPTILIIGGNISFFQKKEIMLLSIPFLVYSLLGFQIYLFRLNQSISIGKNIKKTKSLYQSIFNAKQLLVVYLNTQNPRLLLYFPDGHQAGEIKKYREKGFKIFGFTKTFALYNFHDQVIGFFKVKGKKHLKIEIYDRDNVYLGCYEKKKVAWRKQKKEWLDASGRYIGAVEGSTFFMDEHLLDNSNRQVGRLRRGWMPLEWSPIFPEPNTPVLSFWEGLSEVDKLVRMSFLINEYFIER
ncbi:hypothetical protein [Neobacillus ginsengisoli]|uniref:NERD domain-containing protein n=1 Tax=Neobacillus ginsengisoli TaxID=904295 RepID=A0ABT9XQS7_9BACI|nr:hypothetical protein [Neobacillus ginsengisoli]MDQ0197701.1 hypothetical protein [Neobacillus ginsengisoli]